MQASLLWEHRILATGQPGKSQAFITFEIKDKLLTCSQDLRSAPHLALQTQALFVPHKSSWLLSDCIAQYFPDLPLELVCLHPFLHVVLSVCDNLLQQNNVQEEPRKLKVIPLPAGIT